MGTDLRVVSIEAISVPVREPDRPTVQTVTVSDSERWFADLARQLLPKDAGFALHVCTGFEERTCYRYAAGDRKPPAYFLRALLRSEQGWTWLAAVMDGAEPEWWRTVQAAAASRSKLEEIRALIERD